MHRKMRKLFKTLTTIVLKQKDPCHFDLCSLDGFSSLLEIMPPYHLWTLHSKLSSQCFYLPPFILEVLVYRHRQSVNCSLYKEFHMAYSKYFFSLGYMIVGVRERPLLQGSQPQCPLLLCFLLPTLWPELKDTAYQFG